MKDRIILSLALTGLLALPARAEPRTITMTGHGEVKAAPDEVQIHAGVVTSAATAAEALAANNARMKALFDALRKMGVAERDIQTASFSVSPQYTGGANNERPRLTGYQVNNDVSLRLEDVSKLGTALDMLVRAGANQMHGIDFSIREPAPLLQKARAAAVADARLRAETYAQAAGVALGTIQTISESGGTAPPRPLFRAMAAESVPVAPGEEGVSADVSITWEIH